MELYHLLIVLIVLDCIFGNAEPIFSIFGIETQRSGIGPADLALPKVPAKVGTFLQNCYLVVLVFSYVAMARHLAFGRPLYLGAWALSLLILSLAQAPMQTRLGHACSLLSGLTGGLIIGLVYFSPLAAQFHALRPAHVSERLITDKALGR